jgi:hypothetical protein
MAGGVPRALRSMSAEQIAKRCEELGARIEVRGSKWWVFPPDPAEAPVSFSRLAGHMSGNGTAQANLLSDLRRRGLDLFAEAREAQNVKPARPEENTVSISDAERVNGASPYTQDVTVKPFDYRQGYKDLTAQYRSLSDATNTLMAEAETKAAVRERELDERIRALAGRVRALEKALEDPSSAPPAPPKPSKSARAREIVLAFFHQHRGMKMSPMTAEANLTEELEALDVEFEPLAKHGKTFVAGICRDLAQDGKLCGGGATGKRANGGVINSNHGLYWAPVETTEEDKA